MKGKKQLKKITSLLLSLVLSISMIFNGFDNFNVYAASNYGVAVGVRVPTTSFQTFTNPRDNSTPSELAVYLDVTIEKEGVTGGYVDIPLNYQTPSSYSNPGTGDFFIYNQTKTESSFGSYVDSSSIENIDGVDVLRIKLKDNLMQGNQTLVLYFDFNSDYDSKVAFSEVLWQVSAVAYANDETDTTQVSSTATSVTVKSSVSDALNAFAGGVSHPTHQWATTDGNITESLSWWYERSYENLIDDSDNSYLYFDLPTGSTFVSGAYFAKTSTYIDTSSGVSYDRYTRSVTNTSGWGSLNSGGITGNKFNSISLVFTPPTGYVSGDTFTIKSGISLDLINAGTVTKEVSSTFTVIEEKEWDFYSGETSLYQGTGNGSAYVKAGDGTIDNYAIDLTTGANNAYVQLGWITWNVPCHLETKEK